MDLKELELEFDILLNNVSSNQAPGFTPLEKSIFLTEAQEFYIKELYSTNGFEKNEEISEYLRTLVKQVIYTEEEGIKDETGDSIFFNIPEDLWFITYEAARLNNKCDKLQVILGSLSGREEHGAVVGTEAPVVMLARAVDTGKGLLVQQYAEIVAACDFTH